MTAKMGDMFETSLVIFDCDGVLVDSERLTVAVEARVLTELGWDIGVDEVVERFMGRSDTYMHDEIARRLGRGAAEEFDRVSTDEIVSAFRERLQPVAGVAQLLADLDRAGIATCVASSGSHRKMRLTLGITDLYDFFDGRIFSASEVERGKPAPDLFLHAAREMGVEHDAAVVVEDSVAGVTAARAAGMRCLGFGGGLTPRTRLEAAGADVFDAMADVADLVIAPPQPSGWTHRRRDP